MSSPDTDYVNLVLNTYDTPLRRRDIRHIEETIMRGWTRDNAARAWPRDDAERLSLWQIGYLTCLEPDLSGERYIGGWYEQVGCVPCHYLDRYNVTILRRDPDWVFD